MIAGKRSQTASTWRAGGGRLPRRLRPAPNAKRGQLDVGVGLVHVHPTSSGVVVSYFDLKNPGDA